MWALARVVVNQYQNSLITSLTAIVCISRSGSIRRATPVRYSESRQVRGKLVLVVYKRLDSALAESMSSGEVPGGTAA